MERKVKFSAYSMIMSCVLMAILVGVFLTQYYRTGNEVLCWVLLAIMVVWCALALFYAPVSVSVDGKTLSINRTLYSKKITLTDIKNVKLCPPTMAERRLLGSGGFFGYWGWFSERDLGKYFAFYGKSSDTFFITLSNGRSYMIGCTDAPEMAKAIEQAMAKRH